MILESRATPTLIAVLALAASACESSARDATWWFELEPASIHARAVEIEATIREGGCGGDTIVYQARISPQGGGSAPPVLGPGRYGFAGRAQDAECVWFAAGCVDLQLPAAGVVVRLTELAEPTRGECAPLDAGTQTDSSAPIDGSTPVLVPSNVDETLFVDEGDLDFSADRTLDTNQCESLPGEPVVVARADAPELCVLRARRVTVAANADVRVIGARPLVILASGDIEIDGVLDASARGTEPGAGGGRGATRSSAATGLAIGRPGAHQGTYDDGGGGGGAACGAGGAGGRGDSASGGAGAAAIDPAAMLEPLRGGSGGGLGGGGESAGAGGAGGGALQLSARGQIRIRGTVLVSGGGGRGGADGTSGDANIGSGGGGGSGGALLLEAPVIDIAPSAALWASGGAGGGGAGCRTAGDADDGEDGARTDRSRARGGARGPSCGTFNVGGEGAESGGSERLAGASALDIASADGAGANGGGGGGGAGCILFRNATGALPASLRASPALAPGLRAEPATLR